MGIITCTGQLALNPKTVRTAAAVAKGRTSDRDPPPQRAKSANQFILSIYYPQYYAIQRQYIDQGHPEILRQSLRSFGMTDKGIADLEETGQVRSTVHHGCPSKFRLTYVAERGAELNKGALLFECGEVAVMAGLPKRVVQHLEPGAQAYAYPQNWPAADKPEGRRLSVRVAYVDAGVWSDYTVYLSVDGVCPSYAIGTPFNLEFDIPALPNGLAMIGEKNPSDNSVRPSTWLPPRGISGGYLPLSKKAKRKPERPVPNVIDAVRHPIFKEAQQDPAPPLIKNGGYKPMNTPEHPPVANAASKGEGGLAAVNVITSVPTKWADDGLGSRCKSRKFYAKLPS